MYCAGPAVLSLRQLIPRLFHFMHIAYVQIFVNMKCFVPDQCCCWSVVAGSVMLETTTSRSCDAVGLSNDPVVIPLYANV